MKRIICLCLFMLCGISIPTTVLAQVCPITIAPLTTREFKRQMDTMNNEIQRQFRSQGIPQGDFIKSGYAKVYYIENRRGTSVTVYATNVVSYVACLYDRHTYDGFSFSIMYGQDASGSYIVIQGGKA